jgi:hypothetical protein
MNNEGNEKFRTSSDMFSDSETESDFKSKIEIKNLSGESISSTRKIFIPYENTSNIQNGPLDEKNSKNSNIPVIFAPVTTVSLVTSQHMKKTKII